MSNLNINNIKDLSKEELKEHFDKAIQNFNDNPIRQFEMNESGYVEITPDERNLLTKYGAPTPVTAEDANIQLTFYSMYDKWSIDEKDAYVNALHSELKNHYCDPTDPDNIAKPSTSGYMAKGGGAILGFVLGGPVGAMAGYRIAGSVVEKNACENTAKVLLKEVASTALGGSNIIASTVGGTLVDLAVDKASEDSQEQKDIKSNFKELTNHISHLKSLNLEERTALNQTNSSKENDLLESTSSTPVAQLGNKLKNVDFNKLEKIENDFNISERESYQKTKHAQLGI